MPEEILFCSHIQPGARLVALAHEGKIVLIDKYSEILRAKQQTAFSESGADDWDAFWDCLGCELGQLNLQQFRNEAEYWEGSDELWECGFEQVEFHWQDLGEAVIGARKPMAR